VAVAGGYRIVDDLTYYMGVTGIRSRKKAKLI
jgi:hypothetical protein